IVLATSVAGHFDNEYYQLLAKENADKNLITSPLALKIVLAMAYEGAKDNTALELKNVLDLAEREDVAGQYKAFFKVLAKREANLAIDIANSIYVNEKFHVIPEFSKLATESFKSQAVGISLGNAEKSAEIVNKWVKEKTRDKIPNVITAKDIGAKLQILLVNAFSFKGNWLFKFHAMKTKNENFTPASGKAAPVKIMSQYGFFKAADWPEMDAKVLQLPYHKSSLSMFIFLPNKPNGLVALEVKIGDFNYTNLTSRRVHIKLPKFKIDFTSELSRILKKLGIVDAFGANANLQDLVQEKSAAISKVIQKGLIEVNEEGSGFLSMIGIRDSFISNKPLLSPLDFQAVHPFAYVIRDEKSIYFQGHFVKPE
ncbi:hypothetical protein KR059_002552, partial [Drosophila kikkawai]